VEHIKSHLKPVMRQ